MAKMIKCNTCSKEISNKAKACPHCGNPLPKRTSFVTWFVLFLFVVVVYNLLTNDTSKTPSPKVKASDIVKTKNKISSKTYFVAIEQLNVRLDPSKEASITNTLYENQKIDVYEIKNGWARISEYYNGTVEGRDGRVARWVSVKYLSRNPPVEKEFSKSGDSALEEAIRGSNNYSKYKKSFIKASETLIQEERCTLNDFKKIGGWVRSSTHKPKPIFFTYCGRMTTENRIYLNAETGKLFK